MSEHFENANISGSQFLNVNLSKSKFDDVNLSQSTFHNINFSDVSFIAAQLGGTKFQHIGLPSDTKGDKKQKGLIFDQCDLNDSQFFNCNLQNVKLENCQIDGMTINGYSVQELINHYKK